MHYVTVVAENSGPIDLSCLDQVSEPPVVLIHDYPRSGRSCNRQLPALLDAGRRVITCDRRGGEKSTQPTIRYDYDTSTVVRVRSPGHDEKANSSLLQLLLAAAVDADGTAIAAT